MGNPALRYVGLFLLSLFLGACNLSRWVPEGEYRLDENEILIDGKSAPSRVENILKQRPTMQFQNAVYSWGNPNDSSGFARWVSRQGTAPTIFSEPLAERTRSQLHIYYFNEGYFWNKASYHLEIDTPTRDVDVIYEVELGPRYTFNTVKYDIPSPLLSELVLSDTANSLINKGEPYQESTLASERDRLSRLFRNDGFFGFSKEWIRFTADTTAGNRKVDLTMRVVDRPVRTIDTAYTIPHERYNVGTIYIDYGFNYLNPDADYQDTTTYENYRFLIRDSARYHPHLISRAIHFSPGDQFNSDVTTESYKHISSLGVFGAAEIEFTPAENGNPNDLDAFIKLTPLDKRSFTTQLEGTSTSNFYGISGNIGWLNRNLFGAGEILTLSLNGGIQAQLNYQSNTAQQQLFNTYEIGGEASLNFSRFLLPLSFQSAFPKNWRPSTRITASFSQQTRVEFQRRIARLSTTFQARPRENWTAQLTIPDLNYVNLLDFDTTFINSLFFKTGFQDNLIAASRLVLTYNPPASNQLYRQFLRFSVESSGLLMNTVDGNFQIDGETGQRILFDVPYAQYIRGDIDYRMYIATGPKSQLVGRAFLGMTYNYGNSPFLPPFEKTYLAGGSQDIRGWVAYRLGPGELPYSIYDRESYAAVAPIKAMINLEYRFPLIGSLNGAAFMDAGNVWLWDRNYRLSDFEGLTKEEIEAATFKWNRVLPSSALGTGVGLRYDFGFFQLRLDGGIKVWDPTEPEGYRYVLNGLKWSTVTFNFGVNYPF